MNIAEHGKNSVAAPSDGQAAASKHARVVRHLGGCEISVSGDPITQDSSLRAETH